MRRFNPRWPGSSKRPQSSSVFSLHSLNWPSSPPKKLLFMGGELGQFSEWSEKTELDWGLLELPGHLGLKRLMTDLNAAYKKYPAMHELDDEQAGFRWIDAN